MIIKGKIEEIFNTRFDELNDMKTIENIYDVLYIKFYNYRNNKLKSSFVNFLKILKNIDSENVENNNIYKELKDAILLDYENEKEEKQNKALGKKHQQKKVDYHSFINNINNFKEKYKILKNEKNLDNFNRDCSKAFDIFENYKRENIFNINSKDSIKFQIMDIQNNDTNTEFQIFIETERGYWMFNKNDKLFLPLLNIKKQQKVIKGKKHFNQKLKHTHYIQ